MEGRTLIRVSVVAAMMCGMLAMASPAWAAPAFAPAVNFENLQQNLPATKRRARVLNRVAVPARIVGTLADSHRSA